MAKFVHVDGERVRSGMRRMEALLESDDQWAQERLHQTSLAEETKERRDREFAATADISKAVATAEVPNEAGGR